MNVRLIVRTQGELMLIEAALMLPSLIAAIIFQEGDVAAFGYTMGLLVLLGTPIHFLIKPKDKNLKVRDGFVTVALAWTVLSLFGALPLMISGVLPRFIDAFFEAVAGFTTTGETVITNFDAVPRGIMFWRSFMNWVGGMGILVFTLALMPKVTGRTSFLMRAESAGPSMSKLVPKLSDSAKLLYVIYGAMTLLMVLVLLLCGMNVYDALIHAFATAGTGGFTHYAASVGTFNSPVINGVITLFMLLFSINFALYFKTLWGSWKDALKSEELHWFLGVVVIASVLIVVFITPLYGSIPAAINHGTFQVASIVSTTGYVTQDFMKWPQNAQVILLLLMMIGGCAGSTAGGFKVVRLGILVKTIKRAVRQTFQPRKMQVLRFEGKGLDEAMPLNIMTYFAIYMVFILLGAFLLSFDSHYTFFENLTVSLTTVNNVGIGFGRLGPYGNFHGYSDFSKVVLSFLMLAGRLEFYPFLVLLTPAAWHK